ncbi:MAG: hypothetical protein ACXADY_09535 [Candidatus Hodarchaeales archaeon]
MVSDTEFSDTEKWIKIVLKDLVEATTFEIIERVSMFNQDCVDRIPIVLTQMRIDGKISNKIVSDKDGERQNIVWQLIKPQSTDIR